MSIDNQHHNNSVATRILVPQFLSTNSGKSSIEKAELQIKKQIQQHITNLALKRVTSQLKDFMTPSAQSKLIDSNISQLGGQI